MLITLVLVAVISVASAVPFPTKLTPAFPEYVRSNRVGRIVNGYPANGGQFPHFVRVLSHASTSSVFVCGGAIISEDYVLTAAHCTKQFTTFEMGFGSVIFMEPQITIRSDIKFEHKGYDASNLNNDISLIQLPLKLSWTNKVSPVQLPSYTQAKFDFVGIKSIACGFGKTDDHSTEEASTMLNYVYQRVIGNSECMALYGPDVVKTFTICSRGWDHNNQGTCSGDSGGPLTTYDKDIQQDIIIGIVSFVSSRGCAYGDPAGFVRVTEYLKWIKDTSGVQIRP